MALVAGRPFFGDEAVWHLLNSTGPLLTAPEVNLSAAMGLLSTPPASVVGASTEFVFLQLQLYLAVLEQATLAAGAGGAPADYDMAWLASVGFYNMLSLLLNFGRVDAALRLWLRTVVMLHRHDHTPAYAALANIMADIVRLDRHKVCFRVVGLLFADLL